MRVIVGIPTVNRVDSLFRTLRAINAQTYEETSTIVVVDGDARGRETIDERETEERIENVIFLLNENRIGWIRSQNRILREFDPDFFLYGADDIEPRSNCIERAIDAMNERFPDGDGLIGIKQVATNGKSIGIKTAFGLIGRKFINRFPGREVFCPEYRHYFSDEEIGRFASSIDRFYFCEEAVLTHYWGVKDEAYFSGHERFNEEYRIHLAREKSGLVWGLDFRLIGDLGART